MDRFWAKVVQDGDCWVWTGSKTPGGYGQIKIGGRAGKAVVAHRWSYENMVAEIPVGGHRQCKTCHRAAVNAGKRRRRAAAKAGA